MSYIKTTISDYGTGESFATALKDFFMNNEVAPFNLISEGVTESYSYPVFTVERNNLNLKFQIGGYGEIHKTTIKVSNKNSNGEYVENITYQLIHGVNAGDPCARALKILLIENNGSIVLQMADWNAVSVDTGITTVDTVLNNGVNLIGACIYSNGTTISLKDTELQLVYSPRAFHTGSNDEATLILSNQLAINQSNGNYFSDTTGLISAGGAKQFGYYKTALNAYYGVLANVCIPMGDMIEYIISDTTE
jgi:hypothetical protein